MDPDLIFPKKPGSESDLIALQPSICFLNILSKLKKNGTFDKDTRLRIRNPCYLSAGLSLLLAELRGGLHEDDAGEEAQENLLDSQWNLSRES